MSARHPFGPDPQILRGNADLGSVAGVIPAVSTEVRQIEQALDELKDPELVLAAKSYGLRLYAIPRPDAPEAMP